MERIELDHRDVAACAYALIDPQFGDARSVDAWNAFPQHDLTPRGFESHAAGLPRLVDLRGLAFEDAQRLIGLVLETPADKTPCVALLQTSASIESMQIQLRSRLAPHFPGDAQGLFLFHDPVVFEHLWWMLDTRGLSCLLGPIDRWLLPLRGAWYAAANPGDALQRSVAFGLRADQWSRVYRIAAIHAVLSTNPVWLEASPTWGPRADALLARAAQRLLTNRDDAITFAVQGLRWHARLDEHPRVAQVLTQCIGHPVRYQRLTGGWSDADWQTIAAELNPLAAKNLSPSNANHPSQGVC